MQFSWSFDHTDPERNTFLHNAEISVLLSILSRPEARPWCYSALWQREDAQVVSFTIQRLFSKGEDFSEGFELLRSMPCAEIQQGIERFVVQHPEARSWTLRTLLPRVGGSLFCLERKHAVSWPFYPRNRTQAWQSLLPARD